MQLLSQYAHLRIGAKKRGIARLDHHYINYEHARVVSHLVAAVKGEKALDKKFTDEITLDKDYCDSIYHTDSVPNTGVKIWDRAKQTCEYCRSHRTLDVGLTFRGVAFRVWTVARFHPAQAQDLLSFVISYDPKDYNCACNLLKRLNDIHVFLNKQSNVLTVIGGLDIRVKRGTWDDLVLSDEIDMRVRRDIERWIANEDWYRKTNVPYRRGYLFEGPPGNGKTAVARVVISTYDLHAYTIGLSEPDVFDKDLTRLFTVAADCAPSLVLLEDLDRFFPKGQPPQTNASLSGLLNCLDGVASADGVVVIATANHPENLDPAIRLRPGRFDVPVRFDNPDEDQRTRYLHKLLYSGGVPAKVSTDVFRDIVERTAGFSMAFIRSVYEFSMTTSGLDACTDAAIIAAFESVSSYYEQMKTGSDRRAGFNQKSWNSDRAHPDSKGLYKKGVSEPVDTQFGPGNGYDDGYAYEE